MPSTYCNHDFSKFYVGAIDVPNLAEFAIHVEDEVHACFPLVDSKQTRSDDIQ